MNLIIYHETAWKQACAKYQLVDVEPKSWPILVSFTPAGDSITSVDPTVITADQAAKFLTYCTNERWLKINEGVRAKLRANIPMYSPEPPGFYKVHALDPITGKTVTIKTTVHFDIGETIAVNGAVYAVTGIETEIQATDPITGEKGMVEIGDEGLEGGTSSAIPGFPGPEKLPIDPSKFDAKHKIAEISDDSEHVLDVERVV